MNTLALACINMRYGASASRDSCFLLSLSCVQIWLGDWWSRAWMAGQGVIIASVGSVVLRAGHACGLSFVAEPYGHARK